MEFYVEKLLQACIVWEISSSMIQVEETFFNIQDMQ